MNIVDDLQKSIHSLELHSAGDIDEEIGAPEGVKSDEDRQNELEIKGVRPPLSLAEEEYSSSRKKMNRKQQQQRNTRPRFDRIAKIYSDDDDEYDERRRGASSSFSSSFSEDEDYSSILKTHSLDILPNSYTDRTSFRIGGGDNNEIDRICLSLGLSGPEDFAISPSDWKESKAKSSSDLHSDLNPHFYHANNSLVSNNNTKLEKEKVGVVDKDGGVLEVGDGGGGGGGIKGVRPPLLALPPSMSLPIHDNSGSTWDLINSFAPEDNNYVSEAYSSDENEQEELEIDTDKELDGERSGESRETDLSSFVKSYSEDRSIIIGMPTGSKKKIKRISMLTGYNIRSWIRGAFLLSGSNGTVVYGGGLSERRYSEDEREEFGATVFVIDTDGETDGERFGETDSSSLAMSYSEDYSSTTTEHNIIYDRFMRNIGMWTKGTFLGSGSYGTVYEGFSEDGFLFAVKEVSFLDQENQGSQSIYQLEQEITLLSNFEHENIVQYLGTHKNEGKLYISIELVTKGSLVQLYQEHDLRDWQVSSYTRQILHGLKYLHDRGVVHRDIKCANILMDANGSVKLADFGLSKTTKLNDAKSSKGTTFWMAPEVVNRKNTGYGLSSDIWSLGCTVLEMLTCQHPYAPLEWKEATYRIGKGEPPSVPRNLSPDARDFILKCLQVKPQDRPTAAMLLEHPFVKKSLTASSSSDSPFKSTWR